jgi:hypothetical protein
MHWLYLFCLVKIECSAPYCNWIRHKYFLPGTKGRVHEKFEASKTAPADCWLLTVMFTWTTSQLVKARRTKHDGPVVAPTSPLASSCQKHTTLSEGRRAITTLPLHFGNAMLLIHE